MDLKELMKYSSEKAEEYLEFTDNEEFNNRLDNGDIEGYELILRKPDGEEQALSPISAALFVSDLPTYRQLVNNDLEQSKKQILNLDEFPTNARSYERLLSIIKNKAIMIPFIGAGFSVSAGCPSWSAYIINQAIKSGMNKNEIEKRLKNGEHENVMNEVILQQTIEVFKRDFRSEFEGRHVSPALSPARELVDLFEGCAITTNFDRVLESALLDISPFIEKTVGKDDSGRFLKAIFSGEKYLLKLHGNIDDQRYRILTQDEYNSGYGNGSIQDDLPIPRTLLKIFGSYSVLFLGCSLVADRYLQVLEKVYKNGVEYMPDHFAILTAPNEEHERIERDKYLACHGISPIWFTEGEWDKPAEILKLLKAEKNR